MGAALAAAAAIYCLICRTLALLCSTYHLSLSVRVCVCVTLLLYHGPVAHLNLACSPPLTRSLVCVCDVRVLRNEHVCVLLSSQPATKQQHLASHPHPHLTLERGKTDADGGGGGKVLCTVD